jgi:hypothetical protein
MRELGPLLVFQTPVSGVFRPAIGDHGYIVRSGNMDDIKKAIKIVHETIKETS